MMVNTIGSKDVQVIKKMLTFQLNAVLRGDFSSDVEACTVVDCRYPYEYAGGHIAGAKNVYTKEAILDELFKSNQKAENKNKRHIVVFHCEFSSERGPLL